MDLIPNLLQGFQTAVTPINLLYCLIGVFIGTLIGVLPGLGPTATVAMLLPASFVLPPVSALIMLAGIYYGAQYGGTITSVLVNLPGEASTIVTTIDGYQMALQGRGGIALTAAAAGSFCAGCVATLLIALFAPPLTRMALQFGPTEYFSLMVLGLVASVVLASGSLLKAMGMIVLGLLLGLIGTDVNSNAERYTFGVPELADGVGFVVVAMGMFGVGEILLNIEREKLAARVVTKLSNLWPTAKDWKRIIAPVIRGTLIGSALGVLPGGGAMIASFGAYSLEKKASRNSSEFGKGAIEGVAAPESANNAGAQMSFVPMLTLGIPSNPVMALMIGALIMHGIQPGPAVVTQNPDLFWGVVVSMWIGNLFLIVLNIPLIGIWVRICLVPYHLLYPAILVFCAIGVYSLSNNVFDVYFMAIFGILGYIFARIECEPAPMLLAFILGPMMEEYLRRALLISKGDPTIFLRRPISALILILAIVSLLVVISPSLRAKRKEAFQE